MKRLRLQLLLPIAVLSALPGVHLAASAQAPTAPTGPTYRIVSPDGKVTYSDRQPTDPKLQTRELGRAAPTAQLFTPGSQLFDPPRVLPSGANPSGRFADKLSPPLDTSGRPFPPGLPDAILSVVGHQFFVQTLVESCARLGPAALARYQTIVLNWRNRNVDMLTRSNRITFTQFTGEQRDLLRATARSRLQPLLAPPDASDAERSRWCDRSADDLLRRQLELVNNERLAPIVDFPQNRIGE
jgi:hypothetical protein